MKQIYKVGVPLRSVKVKTHKEAGCSGIIAFAWGLALTAWFIQSAL